MAVGRPAQAGLGAAGFQPDSKQWKGRSRQAAQTHSPGRMRARWRQKEGLTRPYCTARGTTFNSWGQTTREKKVEKNAQGLPWGSSGSDSTLPMQEAWV